MNRRAIQYFFNLILILILASWGSPAISHGEVDDTLYGELLKKYVTNVVVNYEGFKTDEAKLDQYLLVLEKTDTRNLSQSDQLGFYINAYNAWTIKLILSGYPGIKSIKDLGGFFSSPWKKKICHIDGQVISLDDLEYKIRRFGAPRVHFAINCASKSCPPLRSEPFQGDILNEQLDAAARAFIDDSVRNRLEGDTLYVSKIFDWYSEDFNDDIVGFFMKYAKGDFKERLLRHQKEIKVKYLDYDWSLNGH
jgi:hypothetical protein